MPRRTAATKDKPALTELRGQATSPPLSSNPALAGDPKDLDGSMRRPPGLPDGCPVVPLGYKGKTAFYLSPDNVFVEIPAEKLSINNMLWLYGGMDYLYSVWPRYGDDGVVTGIKTVHCYSDHITSVRRAGPFDPANRIREAGGWQDNGELVLHCGTLLYVKRLDGVEYEKPPGLAGQYIYAKGEAQPRPWPDAAAAGPFQKLLEALQSWNWVRGELDAMLLLGWVASAVLGGALKWRPMVWITGEREWGKSEVHRVLDGLLGGSLVHTTNTTAAGIYQHVRLSSLPVTIDELEASDDNRRAQQIIDLATQSSSGGVTLRGGQGHEGIEFTSRSCFLFSSILIPPMLPAPLSRLAILGLNAWTGVAHGLGDEKLEELGRKLRRRILDGWPKWAERFALWCDGLKRLGHSQRTRDQFGTLLAAADMILNDELPHADNIDDALRRWNMQELAERSDNAPDFRRMAEHLMTNPLEQIRRGGAQVNAARLLDDYFHTIEHALSTPDAIKENALRDLMSIGLKPHYLDQRWWLAIANSHQGLARVFEAPTRSHWAGKSGTIGVWVQAARRIPGARWNTPALRFNGASMRVTLVPIEEMLPPDTAPLAGAG